MKKNKLDSESEKEKENKIVVLQLPNDKKANKKFYFFCEFEEREKNIKWNIQKKDEILALLLGLFWVRTKLIGYRERKRKRGVVISITLKYQAAVKQIVWEHDFDKSQLGTVMRLKPKKNQQNDSVELRKKYQ